MVRELEATLKPFGARPHFGKLNLFGSDDIRANFPPGAIDQFRALCAVHDPCGKFCNQLVRSQIFGHGPAYAY